MGWIDTILSLLGRTSDGDRETGDAEITVEKEPEATTERAVKEPVESEQTIDEQEEKPDEEQEEKPDEEPADEPEEETVDEAAAETGEAGDGESVEPDDEESLEVPDGESVDTDEDQAGEPETAGASVTTIKGIGDAYADRLAAAGVESIDTLANADAEALSADTGISEKRLQRWIDRAEDN